MNGKKNLSVALVLFMATGLQAANGWWSAGKEDKYVPELAKKAANFNVDHAHLS